MNYGNAQTPTHARHKYSGSRFRPWHFVSGAKHAPETRNQIGFRERRSGAPQERRGRETHHAVGVETAEAEADTGAPLSTVGGRLCPCPPPGEGGGRGAGEGRGAPERLCLQP